MTPALASLLSSLFKPLGETLDALFTSDAERLSARNKLVQIQQDFAGQMLAYESQLIEAQKATVVAEINGQSWLQRNWRPVLMLCFVAIIANNYILCPYVQLFAGKAVALEFPDRLWDLMVVGVGGYIGGRSLEKIIPQVTTVLKGGKAPE